MILNLPLCLDRDDLVVFYRPQKIFWLLQSSRIRSSYKRAEHMLSKNEADQSGKD
jgi:hypothetical protein